MSQTIKAKDQILDESLVVGLIGKFIHVPTNIHKVTTTTGATTEANVWFSGQVAGYEKAIVQFDHESGEFREEPKTYFNVLLTDGMGYVLTIEGALEILEVTVEEFGKLLEFHRAEQEAKSKNILDEESKGLELMDGESK